MTVYENYKGFSDKQSYNRPIIIYSVDLVDLKVIPFQSMATNLLFKILVGSNKSRFDLLRFGCLKLDNFQLRFLIIDQCGHVV